MKQTYFRLLLLLVLPLLSVSAQQVVRPYWVGQYQSVFMCAPVSGQQIGQVYNPAYYLANPGIYTYSPPAELSSLAYNEWRFNAQTGQWVELTPSAVMEPGVGYVETTNGNGVYNQATVPSNYTQVYDGPINDGTINVNVVGINNSGNIASNLLGNPYPDFLDADSFLLDEVNSGVLGGPILLWSNNTVASDDTPGDTYYNFTSNDYALYNVLGGVAAGRTITTTAGENFTYNMNIPNGKIMLGTGFFVKGFGSGGTARYTNDMRIPISAVDPGDVQQFRNSAQSLIAPPERHRIWISLEKGTIPTTGQNANAFKQALIGYADGATDADNNRVFDAEVVTTSPKIDIYSFAPPAEASTKMLAIQGLGLPLEYTDYFQLGYKVTDAGTYTITAFGDGIFEGGYGTVDYFLWENGTLHTFPHEFTVTGPETNNTRFRVVFRPKFTQLNPSFCNTTLDNIGTPINATYIYGATSYHWEITNTVSHEVGHIVTPSLQTSLTAIPVADSSVSPDFVAHDTTYNVQIAIEVNGILYDLGPLCTVTTPPLVITNNVSIACGSGPIPFETQISCTSGEPYNYNWHVERSDHAVRTFNTETNAFIFFSGGSPIEMRNGFMRYNTQYCIKVRIDYGNDENGNPVYGPFTAVCCHTTPNAGTIRNNVGAVCGDALIWNAQVSCVSMSPYQYHWFVERADGVSVEFDTASNAFHFFGGASPAVMGGSFYRYDTFYCIKVRPFSSGYTGPYSDECCYKTSPYLGTITNNKNTPCGGTLPNTVNHQITTTNVISPYTFDWLIERQDGVILDVTPGTTPDNFTTTTSSFLFKSGWPGLGGGFLLPNTEYCFATRANYGDGTFSNYGPACCLTTQNGSLRLKGGFEVLAMPNPFASHFNLRIETQSEEKVQVSVFDLLGKLVESRNVDAAHLPDIEIGRGLASGLYHAVVTQGEETRTIKIVKQ